MSQNLGIIDVKIDNILKDKYVNKSSYLYNTVIYDKYREFIIAGPNKNFLKKINMIDGQWKSRKFNLLTHMTSLTYNDDLDMYLLGCVFGHVYSYNPNNDELKIILGDPKYGNISDIKFINDNEYIFISGGEILDDMDYYETYEDVYWSNNNRYNNGSNENSESENQENSESENQENSDGESDDEDIVNMLCLGKIDGGVIKTYNNGNTQMTSLLADNDRVFVGDNAGNISIYNLQGDVLKLVNRIKAHKTGITCMNDCYIKSKKYIISSSGGEVKIWDVTKNKLRLIKLIKTNEKSGFKQIICLENLQILICYDFKLRFYDIYTGNKLLDNIITYNYVIGKDGHNYGEIYMGHMFPIDGNKIGIASIDKDEIQIISLLYEKIRSSEYISADDLSDCRFYLDNFQKYLRKHYKYKDGLLKCIDNMVRYVYVAQNNRKEVRFDVKYFWKAVKNKCGDFFDINVDMMLEFGEASEYAYKKSFEKLVYG